MALVVACAVPLSAPADSTQHAIIAQPRFLKLLKASQGSRSEAPSQLELWHGEALCCTAVSRKPGESRCHRADERADWLVVNEGLSQDEAKLQVVREFPDVFAAPEQPQNTTQTQARAVFWLHIPKCGSSFRSSVEMYPVDDAHSTACPEECGPHIDNHVYLPMDASDETIGNVAAIFREPKQRLASQHAHMVKANKPPSWCAKKGRDGGRWGWPSEADCQLVLEKLSLGVDHALGSFDGCQTNMARRPLPVARRMQKGFRFGASWDSRASGSCPCASQPTSRQACDRSQRSSWRKSPHRWQRCLGCTPRSLPDSGAMWSGSTSARRRVRRCSSPSPIT